MSPFASVYLQKKRRPELRTLDETSCYTHANETNAHSVAASLVRFPSADILCAGRQCESTAAVHHVAHPLALIHAHVLHANWTGGWWEAALVAVKEDVNSIAEAVTGVTLKHRGKRRVVPHAIGIAAVV